MTVITEDSLEFTFPTGYEAFKLDEVSYYRSHLQNKFSGTKSVDFVCYETNGTNAYLIEVKDYSTHARTKKIPIEEEISLKVRDSLWILSAIANECNDTNVSALARQFHAKTKIHVYLHLEQPYTARAFHPILSEANLTTALNRILKPVTGKARLSNITRNGSPWTVRRI